VANCNKLLQISPSTVNTTAEKLRHIWQASPFLLKLQYSLTIVFLYSPGFERYEPGSVRHKQQLPSANYVIFQQQQSYCRLSIRKHQREICRPSISVTLPISQTLLLSTLHRAEKKKKKKRCEMRIFPENGPPET
jgi:hypothetical protein